MQVHVLGPLEVTLDDGRRIALGSARQRALLARLAVEAGRPLAPDLLVEELWAGEPPPSGPNALQVFVSRLRRTLGSGAIITGPAGYALAVDPAHVDAVRFERAAAEGRDLLDDGDPEGAAKVLRESLALWRGPAFVDVPDVPGCELESARLEEVRLRALEDRIEADLVRGHHAELADELEILVAQHPFRESLWAKLMLVLYRAGRQADALEHAARLRRMLLDDLGVDPSHELRRLEEAILHQSPELDWTPAPAPQPPPKRVPEPITSFVGRTRELTGITGSLGTNRLVTLTGAGGVGKTRLALAVAADRDLAWVAELAGLTDAALLTSHVAAVADAADASGLIDRLKPVEGLLVLDNCEHLLEACGRLAKELLAACPGLRVLATSREPLGIRGEAVYRVGPLPLPAPDDSDPLAYDAIRLFCDRARAVVADLHPEEHIEAIVDVCRRLDGMPLALELAAARSTALTPEDIRSRLDGASDLLASSSVGSVAHHASLAAALDWSYEALRPAEQATFRMLAVFPGGFTLPDAEAVCQRAVLDDIERLVTVSLLDRAVMGATIRFRMLEAVRGLAEAKLHATDETDEAYRRLFGRMYERFADAGSLAGSQRSDAELEAEDANIRAALSWAIEDAGDPEGGSKLAVALAPWWQLRSRYAEARHWLEAAVRADGGHPQTDVVQARIALGAACLEEGDVAAARSALEVALATAHELGDQRVACRTLVNLGAVAVQANDLPQARTLLEQANEAAGDASDEDLRMRALNNLAQVIRRTGDPVGARGMYVEALACARTLRHAVAEVTMLLNIGEIDRMAGRLDDARDLLEEALDKARRLGYGPAVSAALGALGNVASEEEGGLSRARTYFEESIEVARELGIEPLYGAGIANLASVAESEGHLTEARERYTEYLRLSERLGDERGMARGWRGIADVLRAEGHLRRAARFLSKALDSSAAMADRERMAECLESVASLADACSHDTIARDARLHAAALRSPGEPTDDAMIAVAMNWLSETAAKDPAGATAPTQLV